MCNHKPCLSCFGKTRQEIPVGPSRDRVWAAARPALVPGQRDGDHERVTGVHALQTRQCDLGRLAIRGYRWLVPPTDFGFSWTMLWWPRGSPGVLSSLVLGGRQNSTVLCPSWRNPYRVKGGRGRVWVVSWSGWRAARRFRAVPTLSRWSRGCCWEGFAFVFVFLRPWPRRRIPAQT